MKEIERKWLFDGFPVDRDSFNEFIQSQTYLQFSPENRIRRQTYRDNRTTSYFLETKGDGDLSRDENKEIISKLNYYLLARLNHNMIEKDCKEYQLGGYILIVARVDNSDFFYGEIEFETEEQANAFIVPDWFGKEVTYNKDYKMKNYYRRKYGIEY